MLASLRCVLAFSAVVIVAGGCQSAATTVPTPSTSAVAKTTASAAVADYPWVAYSWPRPADGRWAVFLMRADGSDAHQIVSDIPGEQKVPVWSPDGKTIAFVVRNSDTPEGSVWTANADGSGAALLSAGGTECPVGLFHPAWSPDGKMLAVVCYPGGDREAIAVMDLTTKSLRRLATYSLPDHLDNAPTWSPDGTMLAFDIQHWNPTGQYLDGTLIATLPVAGGEVRRLTSSDTFMSHPDWSPDGLLVMNSYDLGNIPQTAEPSNVFTMKPDGSGLTQLTHSSTDGSKRIGQPRWDPNSSRIVVSVAVAPEYSINDVHVGFVDAAGGEPVVISQLDAKYPDVQPTP